jgi:DNA transposition AAA+ family ATPase
MVTLIETVHGRAPGLPGIGVYYGPSGYGKTWAGTYAANVYRAWQVQMKSVWRPKKLCQEILKEMAIKPARDTADMVDQIAEELARNDRPLLIDEADYLVSHNMVEIVRDIYESSGATIILIGEEFLPTALSRWERFHGRVLSWVGAERAELEDVGFLAPIYCPGVTIDQALAQHLLEQSRWSIRRISGLLGEVLDLARTQGSDRVSRADWGDRPVFNGQAPGPRKGFTS